MMGKALEVAGSGDQSASAFVKAALTIMDPRGVIETLIESAQPRMRTVLLQLALAGYGKVRVASGRRTLDEQRRIFGRGRTGKQCRLAGVGESYADPDEAQVSWCLPEDSEHVRGCAMDVDLSMYEGFPYTTVARVAALAGVINGGEWPQKDGGHFEI